MAKEQSVHSQILSLLDSQLLAALSSQRNGQPYTNLISFVPADDLTTILFATPKATRKFNNIMGDSRVSLLIDNRSNREIDFHEAAAVTVIGKAQETVPEERDPYMSVFLDRHPYLKKFVESPTTALMKITASHYILVTRFQKVLELHLTDELDIFAQ